MRLKIVTVLLLSISASMAWAATSHIELTSQRDKLSYALGVMTGTAYSSHAVRINSNAFALGMQDAISKQKTKLTEKQIKTIIQDFQEENQQAAQSKLKKKAEKNLQGGEAFLRQNEAKPGVITLKSGLQFKVIQEGNGEQPKLTNSVLLEYEGKLIGGKIFDSSYARGTPASFPLEQVIKGWQQALQMMRPGAVWELYIPAKLAYGEADVPGIGPNQTLIFKVHLISIEKN